MPEDPIVAEVRRIREELAAQRGDDIDKMVEAARAFEAAHGIRTVSFEPKPARRQPYIVRERPNPPAER